MNLPKWCGLSVRLLILGSLASCQHNSIIPSSPLISYSLSIQPIISSNCTMSGCHAAAGSGHEEARALTNYEEVMRDVVPGNARQSRLYTCLSGAGEDRMPRGKPALDDKSILSILVWIDQGALNN